MDQTGSVLGIIFLKIYTLILSVSDIQHKPSIAMMDFGLPKNRHTVEYLTDGTWRTFSAIILK
jgi:hypothetical protein